MAQIIKHRRGSIDNLSVATAQKGELVMATGSVDTTLAGPFIFIGDDGGAGAFRTLSKIYQGSSPPNLTSGNWGSTLNGTPFYGSTDQKLYILSNAGNVTMDLTGNIEGNLISGVTINNLTGTTAYIQNMSGSFTGSGIGLYDIPASGITGLELNRISEGNATASISQENGLKINVNTEITGALNVSGDITGSNLQLSGNAFISGNIVLGGNITVGDSDTDFVSFGADISSSIVPDVHNAFDLGSSEKNWRNLHVSGTAYVDILEARQVNFTDLGVLEDLTVSGSTFLGNGGDTLIVSGSIYNDQLTNNRVVIVGTQGLLEDDSNFTFDGTELNIGVGNFTVQQGSGNIDTAGTLNVGGATALESTLTVTGSATLKDNLSVSGTTTVSGATTLQNTLTVNSTSELQGAVGMNSTLDVTGSAQFKSTIDVDSEATLASAIVEDLTQDRIVTVGVGGALIDSSGFTYNGTVLKIGDGQFEVDTIDGDIRTSGSLTVDGTTQLNGNLTVSGNFTVLGSATEVHISSSVIELDDNIIRLNAYSPFERYAGFEVIDSGSIGVSASLVWDGQNDYWMFVSSSGQSSKLIGTTAGTYGSENSLTDTYFPIATGLNTIGNSLLRYSGTTLSFNTNKFTIDSGTGDTTISGGVTLSYSGGTDNGNNTSGIVFRNSNNVLGFVTTTETTDELDGILGYKNSDGGLVFSTLIDGGSY